MEVIVHIYPWFSGNFHVVQQLFFALMLTIYFLHRVFKNTNSYSFVMCKQSFLCKAIHTSAQVPSLKELAIDCQFIETSLSNSTSSITSAAASSAAPLDPLCCYIGSEGVG